MKLKTTALIATMLVVASIPVLTPDTALASEKITRVFVDFTIEGYDEQGYPEITAEVPSSAHYSCGTADMEEEYMDEPDNDDDDYDSSIVTRAKSAAEENYIIEFTAEDGYTFYLTKADQVKLSGAGAKYVKASRLDNGTTLRLTFQLTKLEDVCSPVEAAVWVGDGKASWDSAHNAVRYKLTLSRSGGGSKTYYTGGTTYDFKPVMTKPGDYFLKVTPLSRSDYRAEHAEAGSFHVTKEMADTYSAAYGVETESRVLDGTEGGGPGTVEVIYKNTGWKQDEVGWWYQNDDGSYLQYDWTQLNGDWYFFGSDGYMVTDKVIRYGNDSYYMAPDGKMAVSQAVPDGRKAGADGILTGKMSSEYMEQAEGAEKNDDYYANYGPGATSQNK